MASDQSYNFEPAGTKISGFATNGPYHCEDCIHLIKGYCVHPVVMADPAIKRPRNKEGQVPIYDSHKECCQFVKKEGEK